MGRSTPETVAAKGENGLPESDKTTPKTESRLRGVLRPGADIPPPQAFWRVTAKNEP